MTISTSHREFCDLIGRHVDDLTFFPWDGGGQTFIRCGDHGNGNAGVGGGVIDQGLMGTVVCQRSEGGGA